MRQEELAQLVGVDERSVRKWEKGVPSLNHLLRLATVLDASLDELFT